MIFARGLKGRRETEVYRLHEIATHVEDIWVLCLCMNKERKQDALCSNHVRILGTLLAIRACALPIWAPQHRLSFEKTSNEIRERYANTRKDLAYDIDAFKAFITLESLNRSIKLPMQLFSRLSTRFTSNEKKAKVLVRSGVSPGYKSVAVREIPNLKIGKFNIPHLGETGIYMIFPDLYVASSRHTKADMSQTDVINLERHIISAIKLECDGLHVDCKRRQISEALLYSVTAQYLFSREARESAYINVRAMKQIPEEFLGCWEHCLQTSLKHTTYANALFYLNVYGNKAFNVVGTQKELEYKVDEILQVLKRGNFLSMEIDVAVTKYESCEETALLVCATRDAYKKHDGPSKMVLAIP